MKLENKEVLYSMTFGIFALGIWLVIAVGSLVLTGCGGGEGDSIVNVNAAPESCVPGHMTQCPCDNGKLGYQTCADDGKNYGSCDCPAAPTPEQDAGAEASAEASTGEDAAPEAAAEAGTDAEADTSTEAGTEAGACNRRLDVYVTGPAEGEIVAGTQGATMLEMEFHASGCAIPVEWLIIALSSDDGAMCSGSCSQPLDFYFRNAKLINKADGSTLMGPEEFTKSVPPNVGDAAVEYHDSFMVHVGFPVKAQFIVDVTKTPQEPVKLYDKHYFAQYAGIGSNDTSSPIEWVIHTPHSGGTQTILMPPPDNKLDVQLAPTTPQTDIAVTTLSDLVPFTTYTVANSSSQPVSFDRVGLNAVKSNGFGAQASINCLYGVIGDIWLSSCDIDKIGVTLITVDAPETSIILQAGEQVELKIYARLNPVQPGSIPGDLPRSGDRVRIELQSIMMDATLLYLATSMYGAPAPGNFMILRKTKPIVLMQPLADTHLMSGYRELYRVQIGSDAAGPVAVKQIMLDIEKTSGVMLGQLRVFEGSVALPLDQYTITDAQFGANVRDSIVPTNEDTVAVTFSSELAVTGAGKILSVYGQIQLSGQNNYILVRPSRASDWSAAETGYLLNNTAFTSPVSWAMSADVYHVDDGPLGVAPGDFLWSDVSEVPHNPAIESAGGSKDWTNGHLVLDLTGSATLTQ